MECQNYTVTKIEGEYAYLLADGASEGDEIFIALALLPPETDIGIRLHFELFEYTVIR